MEAFLQDKDVWILGSVCLVATFLWRRIWKVLSVKKRKTTDAEVTQVVTLLSLALD